MTHRGGRNAAAHIACGPAAHLSYGCMSRMQSGCIRSMQYGSPINPLPFRVPLACCYAPQPQRSSTFAGPNWEHPALDHIGTPMANQCSLYCTAGAVPLAPGRGDWAKGAGYALPPAAVHLHHLQAGCRYWSTLYASTVFELPSGRQHLPQQQVGRARVGYASPTACIHHPLAAMVAPKDRASCSKSMQCVQDAGSVLQCILPKETVLFSRRNNVLPGFWGSRALRCLPLARHVVCILVFHSMPRSHPCDMLALWTWQ